MLAKFRSAVSKLRVRQREVARRHAQRRTLRAEPLEGRLLMAGDSWVVAVDVSTGRRHVATDNDGNVYVATTQWLGKFDPAGNELWTKAYQGATAYDLAVIGNDGVYMVGSCGVAVDFDLDDPYRGQITLHSDASDGFVAKFNTDSGDFAWAIPFGGELNDRLIGVTTTDDAVFVTGAFVVPERKTTRTDMLVAKVARDGSVTWQETFQVGQQGESIQVFAPSGSPASVYVAGGPVVKLTETLDEITGVATGAILDWTYPSGNGADIAICTEIIGTTVVPSLYATTRSTDGLSAQLLKFDEQGGIQWSKSIVTGNIGSYEAEMACEDGVVYVTGSFAGQVLFGDNAVHATLTSRGGTDAFVARYAADGGSLLGAQRMGGSGEDGWYDIAVVGGSISATGWSNSANGDYPADNPETAGVSAIVPGGELLNQLFVMHLDAAAPIVHVADADITVAESASVELRATTSAGTITWYDSFNNVQTELGTGTDLTVTLGAGIHLISAIATDLEGRSGMAGVVVAVTGDTKFYVVDDNSANKTFEYDEYGTPVESYSLNTANTAPRGAASTEAGDTTWVVDANRKVYVYNTSGDLIRTWTAGTLSTKAKVEGITVYGNDVWIVDDYSNKVYRYANGALANNVTLTAAASPIPLNSANTTPKDIVTDGTSMWVVNDSTTDMVFKYTLSGTLLGSWTINGGGGSPTGITLDPSNPTSQDLWIVDSSADKVYQYTNGRNVASGTTQTATTTFALATGNGNPQGIADPPAFGSLMTTEAVVRGESVLAELALVGNDAALENVYYEPQRKVRVDRTTRVVSRGTVVDMNIVNYTVGAAPDFVTGNDVHDDDRQSDVDDLFAEWDSDPLLLLGSSDFGL